VIDDARETVSGGDLVWAACAGDHHAWELLVERHAQDVWSTARAQGLDEHEAADVSLLAWTRLADHLPDVVSDDRVGPWLHRVTHDEARATARCRTRHADIASTFPASG
jgi:DNA-directed RNA polymerase specialized sigma24 family protein